MYYRTCTHVRQTSARVHSFTDARERGSQFGRRLDVSDKGGRLPGLRFAGNRKVPDSYYELSGKGGQLAVLVARTGPESTECCQ